MEILFEMLTKFWYLWVLVIVASILGVFMPKIKGFFGEKYIDFVLSGKCII
ncbi:MAG: hypothetical protein MUO60_08380 [Clostridiaceae bacterium]|nr:hypothetical protein [Clostridiaceae bacterium]